MATDSKQWIKSWEGEREKGVWRFLLKWVLGFGMGIVAYNALHWFLGDRAFNIVPVLIEAVVIGLCIGALVWLSKEHKYREQTGTKLDSDA
jgi:hypothetical protein